MFPYFREGQEVVLNRSYRGYAGTFSETGEYTEIEVDLPDDASFEIVAGDYERGFIYDLVYTGEIDDCDYVRVFAVPEGDLSYP